MLTPTTSHSRRSGGLLLAAILVLAGLAPVLAASPVAAAPAASAYDHGHIISDTVMRDFGTMTESQVQAFFKSKVSSCPSAPASRKCLTEYRGNTIAKDASANGCTQAMPAYKDITAARMVVRVAKACQINPRVLIVLMQKEQGLITTVNPTDWQIKNATGWGCPDTNPCSTQNRGLFHQLYSAAWQFNQYMKNTSFFNWLPLNSTVKIKEHPASGTSSNPNKCTTKSVVIKNRATAALYYYTPYYPNASALNNMYGTGNACASYGNRNFWRDFHDWFGSTQTGGYLVKAAGTDTYLLVRNEKFRVTDSQVIDAYGGRLGKVGTISSAYLKSFPDGGTASALAHTNARALYVIDGGKRYLVPGGCDGAAEYGLNCDVSMRLSTEQFQVIPVGDREFSGVVQANDGSTLLLRGGAKREIVDPAAWDGEAGELPTAKNRLSSTVLDQIPTGEPVLTPGSRVSRYASTMQYVYVGGTFLSLDSQRRNETNATKWFGALRGTVSADTLSNFGAKGLPGILTADGETTYLLGSTGLYDVTGNAALSALAIAVPQELIDLMPQRASVGEQFFVTRTGQSTIYFVDGASVQQLRNSATRNRVATTYGLSRDSVEIPTFTFKAMTLKPGLLYVPGTVLQDAKSGKQWVVDSLGTRSALSKNDQKELLGAKPSVVKLTSAKLSEIPLADVGPRFLIQCGDELYLSLQGKRYKVRAAWRAIYADFITPFDGSRGLCASITSSGIIAGAIKSGSTLYEVTAEGRKPLTASAHKARSAELAAIRTVSSHVLKSIPIAQ